MKQRYLNIFRRYGRYLHTVQNLPTTHSTPWEASSPPTVKRGELRRGEEYESMARWPCKGRAGSRSKPERRSTICFSRILNSQATGDAQQPRPPHQQPVERRTLRSCELRAAESDLVRVCDEVRQGKSSLGSTCTSPHRKCVVAEQEVDPHTPRNSSCTQRRWSSDIPTSSLWQKTASGHGIAHRCRKPKAVVAERHNACATTTLTATLWISVFGYK